MKDRTDGHVRGVHAEIDRGRPTSGQVVVRRTAARSTVDVNPIEINGYPVPQSEDADIQVPGYHVVAHATFNDYKLTTDP